MARAIQTVTELRERAARRASGDLSETEFRSQFSALLSRVPPNIIREPTFFSLPANRPPWFDTGLTCREGEEVTVFAAGRAYLSRELDIWLKPSFWLWYRLGEQGHLFRGTRCSHTFTATAHGRLFLAGAFPGEWTTRTGDLSTPADVYQQTEGGVVVLVVRWAVPAVQGLKHLVQLGDVGRFLSSEIDRLETPLSQPEGWEYPWHVGPGEMYTTVPRLSQRPVIGCYTHEEATNLQKDIVLPFTPETRLRWSWKMDQLPSQIREDRLQTHDYLSLAVEFDNEQDLAYYWSAELPPDTAYRCPIPKWSTRETHVVLHSGTTGLGQWVQEERNLYADYKRWVGEPPARILRVWLISLSMFQHGEGQGEYGAIEFLTGDGIVIVN
jgi:hypothetical protein